MRATGDIADTDAFDRAIAAFAAQFGASGDASIATPEATEQAEARNRLVDTDHTLPEEQIDRDDEA